MQEGASRARLSVENGLEQAEVTRGAEQAKVTRGSGREAKRARLSGGEMDMAGDYGKQQSHLVLAPKLFLLSHPDVDDLAKVDLRADILAAVKSDDMAALYELLTADGVEMHAALLAEMHARIDEEIRKLDEKILKADAEENLGDSEVHEAYLAKSLYFIRVGEKAQDNYFGTSSVPICIFKLGCPGTKR